MTDWRHAAANTIERVLGRRNLVRTARFLLDHARRDVPNRIESNGEVIVQHSVTRSRPEVTIFDVGANTGEWSLQLLSAARANGVQGGQLHLFEPAEATYRALVSALGGAGPLQIVFNRVALSDRRGSGTLFKPHELAGSSSLHPVETTLRTATTESVDVRTLDDYCDEIELEHIDLLKVDAEGHDFAVLSGSSNMLAAGRVDFVQFEYNLRWMGARRYLRDAMEFLGGFRYCVGKVTPTGVEWYDRWDPELETMREGNYLAARPEIRTVFPAVPWWKVS